MWRDARRRLNTVQHFLPRHHSGGSVAPLAARMAQSEKMCYQTAPTIITTSTIGGEGSDDGKKAEAVVALFLAGIFTCGRPSAE